MKDGLDYYEISPEITEATAVFPGDQPFERRVALGFEQGHHLALSAVLTTVHIGAHTDAPNHYHPKGESIESRDLNHYLGPCQVIEVKVPRGQRIRLEHIAHAQIETSRVLFKTDSFPDPNRWNGDFNALSAEVIEKLAHKGVVLVGIDTPSIDLAEDKLLEAHQAVYRHDVAVLEGIVLTKVPEGIYTLIALPLRLKGADASPVRAVLLPGSLGMLAGAPEQSGNGITRTRMGIRP